VESIRNEQVSPMLTYKIGHQNNLIDYIYQKNYLNCSKLSLVSTLEAGYSF